jgi:hypothetical protein
MKPSTANLIKIDSSAGRQGVGAIAPDRASGLANRREMAESSRARSPSQQHVDSAAAAI